MFLTQHTLIRLIPLLLAIASTADAAATQRSLTFIREWDSVDARYRAVADIDGDGNREVIVASYNGHNLLVLRADTSARGYAVVGRIPGRNNDRVSSISALDVFGDERPELVIAWTGGRLSVVDGFSLQVRAETRTTSFADAFGVGDVDGDGAHELIMRSDEWMYFLNPATLQTFGSVRVAPVVQSSRFRVGDVFGDARAEILVANGIAYSISRNGQTFTATPVWASAQGAMRQFELADVDGDGKLEALAARYDGRVGIERISPAPAYTQLAAYGTCDGIWLEDLDGDHQLDALATCNDGADRIIALNLQGFELWRLRRYLSGAAAIGRSRNGTQSLIWGSQSELHEEPLPARAGPSWSLAPAGSRKSAVYTHAGEKRIAILTFASILGQRIGAIHFWDSHLREIGGSGHSWLPTDLVSPQSASVSDVIAIDRPDRPKEVLALVGNFYSDPFNAGPHSPRIWIMNEVGVAVRERSVASSLTTISAVRYRSVAALQPQLAMGMRVDEGHGRLMVVGLDDGKVVWESNTFALPSGYSIGLLAEDLDADGSDELIASVTPEVLIYAPAVGTVPLQSHADAQSAAVLPAGTGTGPQLLVARADGVVSIHDGLAPAPERQITIGYVTYTLAAFRDPESGEPLLAGRNNNVLTVNRMLDGEQVARFGTATFGGYEMSVHDLDSDGRLEIYVAGAAEIFRLGSAEIIHDNGFE